MNRWPDWRTVFAVLLAALFLSVVAVNLFSPRGPEVLRRPTDKSDTDRVGTQATPVEDPDSQLRGERSIRVRVVDSEGGPLSDIEVTLGRRRIGAADLVARRVYRTDEDGFFRVTGVPRIEHQLEIPARAPYPATEASLGPGEDDVVIVLSPWPIALQGRVLASPSVAPIEGARVSLDIHQSWVASVGDAEARTDRDGRFTLRRPTATSATVTVSAEGYQTHRLYDRWVDPATVSENELEVRLRPAGHVRGRVVAEDSAPVSGARVALGDEIYRGVHLPSSDWGADSVETDSEGRFDLSLSRTRAGGLYGVSVEHPEYVLAEDFQVEVDDPGAMIDNFAVRVARGGRISGVVRSADRPLQGVSVLLAATMANPPGVDSEAFPTPATRPIDEARTDGEGHFAFSRLQRGTYLLRASIDSYAGAKVAPFEVALGSQVHRDIVLEPELWIAGEVASARGGPVAGASIQAFRQDDDSYWPRATTNEAGRFTVRGLARGRYRLLVEKEDFAGEFIEDIPAGTEDVEVTLYPHGSLRGVVTDLETGEPVEGFTAWLHPDHTDLKVVEETGPIDGLGGRFRHPSVSPGPYRLVVRATGYLEHESAIEIVGGTENRVSVQLDPGGAVEGRILDERGAPIPEARITAFPWPIPDPLDPDTLIRGSSDESGHFRLRGLFGRRYRIGAQHPRYVATGSDPVDVPADFRVAAPQVQLVLAQGASVSGRALDAQGRPLPVGTVRILGGPETKSGSVDSEGNFWIVGVPAGTFRLVYTDDDGELAPVEATLEVAPDEGVVETIIRLVPEGIRLVPEGADEPES